HASRFPSGEICAAWNSTERRRESSVEPGCAAKSRAKSANCMRTSEANGEPTRYTTDMVLGRPLLAVAALALGLCGARPDAARYADMTDEQVSAAIGRAHRIEPLGARVQAVTDPFVGTPYVLGNMGDGPDGAGRD